MGTKASKDIKPTRAQKKEQNKKLYAQVKASETVEPPTTGAIVPKVGRPTIRTPELAAAICMGIAQGNSMRTVCKQEDMPAMNTVFRWLADDEVFREQYTRATEERAESMHEDILDIADDGSNDWMERNWGDQVEYVTNGEALARSKLRVETRKWLMQKMKPKKYGDKLDLTSGGKDLPTPILGVIAPPKSLNPTRTNVIDDIGSKVIDQPSAENRGDI